MPGAFLVKVNAKRKEIKSLDCVRYVYPSMIDQRCRIKHYFYFRLTEVLVQIAKPMIRET